MDYYMDCAFRLAIKAKKKDEVPVGAIIVKNGKIVGKGKNQRHRKNDVLGHAEIIAIKSAQKKLKNWRLYDCDLYVTLKPCNMCLEIIKECRLKNIYYLLEKSDIKNSFNNIKIREFNEYNPEKRKIYHEILTSFFRNKR